MNIFVLDQSPELSAQYHCDQHIHKMILESAQMLSTAMHSWYPHVKPYIYKPAHLHHPCTEWVCASKPNAVWVYKLMIELESIRLSLGHNEHNSMKIANIFRDNTDIYDGYTDPFIFAGPLQFKLRPDLTIYQKYQEYYRLKQILWHGTKNQMSYTNRPVPSFINQELLA